MKVNNRLTDFIIDKLLAETDDYVSFTDRTDKDIEELVASNIIFELENEVDWKSVISVLRNEADDQLERRKP